MEQEQDGLARALASLLSDSEGEPPRIEGLTRLSGGASRETWAFDAVSGDGGRGKLILRRDFPTEGAPSLEVLAGVGGTLSRRGEFDLMRALADQGLPTPRPIAYPDGVEALANSFVMERIEGEALPKRILKDPDLAEARGRLATQLGATLGRFRTIPADALPDLPMQPTETQLAVCRALLDRAPDRRPVFELAYRRLTERRPPHPSRLSIVHGDFRLGNFIVGPEGLRSVIDWEYVHLGDPMEDLGFLCMKPWRFGNMARVVGGFGDRADLIRGYEDETGETVDPASVWFWETLGQLKWGAICAARGQLHLDGTHRSVEVAAIARRIAETEYDLLELMESADAG